MNEQKIAYEVTDGGKVEITFDKDLVRQQVRITMSFQMKRYDGSRD